MGTALRLLLIEDSDDDAMLLLREVRRGGYEPVWRRVDNATDLQAALDGQRWDLITCDWVMPQFNAPAALRLLRECGSDLPVIIVSGEVGEEVAVSALRGGARDYVSKHNLTRLMPAIERELREHAEHQSRRRVEESLRRTQERLRLFIQEASDIIFTLDAEFRISSVNRAACAASGYGQHEMIGKPVFDFLPSEQHEPTRAGLAALYASGGAGDPPAEVEVVDKSGRRRLLEVRGRAVQGDHGTLESFHIARDITERRRAEAERVRLSAALEQAPEPIAITDAEGRIIYLNRACEQMLGVARADVQGQPFTVVLGTHDPGAGMPQLVGPDGRWSGSLLQRAKDGRMRRVTVTVSPVRDGDGRIVNYVGRGGEIEDVGDARAPS